MARGGAATDELARLKIDARQPEEVNPFDSLERALAVQLEQSKSRGNSVRGATNFGRTPPARARTRNGSFGSSGNLQRRNTPMSPKSNLLPRPVKCVFDPSIGEVVCRREDNGDVIFHGEADASTPKLLRQRRRPKPKNETHRATTHVRMYHEKATNTIRPRPFIRPRAVIASLRGRGHIRPRQQRRL